MKTEQYILDQQFWNMVGTCLIYADSIGLEPEGTLGRYIKEYTRLFTAGLIKMERQMAEALGYETKKEDLVFWI